MSVYDINGNEIDISPVPVTVSSYYPNRVKAVAHKKNKLNELLTAYLRGFYYIEVDVNRTSDGYLVLEHDNISTIPYATWNDSPYKLTFDVYIDVVRKLGIHPYIELKQWMETSDCEIVVDLVNDYGLSGKVTYLLSGNKVDLITKMFDIAPDERYGYLTYSDTADILAWKAQGINVFADIGITSSSAIENYKNNNIEVEVWTINSEETMLELNPWVTGVTSDNLLYDQVLLDSLNM